MFDAEVSLRGIHRKSEMVREGEGLTDMKKSSRRGATVSIRLPGKSECCRLTYAQGSSFRIINANDGKARAFNYVEYTSQSLSLPEQLV